MKDSAIGLAGITFNLLTPATDEVQLWVSVISSAVIALTTCGIQVYRAIRDRDKDLSKKRVQSTELKEGDNNGRKT